MTYTEIQPVPCSSRSLHFTLSIVRVEGFLLFIPFLLPLLFGFLVRVLSTPFADKAAAPETQ